MRIAVDTNLLVRALVDDDPHQARLAVHELSAASEIVLSLPMLCELCWVLGGRYRYSKQEIFHAIDGLTSSATAVVDNVAVAAGLAMLEAGGDFADGVIAHLGRTAGAEVFISFDRGAVKRLSVAGHAARSPG